MESTISVFFLNNIHRFLINDSQITNFTPFDNDIESLNNKQNEIINELGDMIKNNKILGESIDKYISSPEDNPNDPLPSTNIYKTNA